MSPLGPPDLPVTETTDITTQIITAQKAVETITTEVARLQQILEEKIYTQDFQALEDCCFNILLTLIELLHAGKTEEALRASSLFKKSPITKDELSSDSQEEMSQTSEDKAAQAIDFISDWIFAKLNFNADNINTIKIKLRFFARIFDKSLADKIQAMTSLSINETLGSTKNNMPNFFESLKRSDFAEVGHYFYSISHTFILSFISNNPQLPSFISAFQGSYEALKQDTQIDLTSIEGNEENAAYYLTEFFIILGDIHHFLIAPDTMHQSRTT